MAGRQALRGQLRKVFAIEFLRETGTNYMVMSQTTGNGAETLGTVVEMAGLGKALSETPALTDQEKQSLAAFCQAYIDGVSDGTKRV